MTLLLALFIVNEEPSINFTIERTYIRFNKLLNISRMNLKSVFRLQVGDTKGYRGAAAGQKTFFWLINSFLVDSSKCQTSTISQAELEDFSWLVMTANVRR